jgi:hypothetical protein
MTLWEACFLQLDLRPSQYQRLRIALDPATEQDQAQTWLQFRDAERPFSDFHPAITKTGAEPLESYAKIKSRPFCTLSSGSLRRLL